MSRGGVLGGRVTIGFGTDGLLGTCTLSTDAGETDWS